MTAHIIQADARHLPLADSSVDLIVTSPPYYGLRTYTDGGAQYDGQIGAEPTPGAYIDALIDCTREWMRVLKPEGSMWVNLGDSYASGGRAGYAGDRLHPGRGGARGADGLRPKTLRGLPWRYALQCVDQLGLILRAEVIWSKPNAIPESVTDRVRRSHETWFHLVKQPRYYAAVDHIREGHRRDWLPGRSGGHTYAALAQPGAKDSNLAGSRPHPAGKLPGSVWEIATRPLTVPATLGVNHFAAFPVTWPSRLIAGWSPPGICTACGAGRRPVVHTQRTLDGEAVTLGAWQRGGVQQRTAGVGNWRFGTDRTIAGYDCDCAASTAPVRPSVVLDPCGGTGTTALAADVLGRTGISVDRSADYCRIARWRIADPGERATAMGLGRPPPPPPGQDPLFDVTELP